MDSGTQNAYEQFMRTGKIEDYLSYVQQEQPLQSTGMAMGESGALYDRSNCTAREANRRI